MIQRHWLVGVAIACVSALSFADDRVGPAYTVGPLKLQKTYVSTGVAENTLSGSTQVAIGSPVTVVCDLDAGCPTIATLEVQLSAGDADDDTKVGVSFYVDGVCVTCGLLDAYENGPRYYHNVNHQSYTRLRLGTHTLQMRASASQSARVYRYMAKYEVFKE
jgi:hypothetical protein